MLFWSRCTRCMLLDKITRLKQIKLRERTCKLYVTRYEETDHFAVCREIYRRSPITKNTPVIKLCTQVTRFSFWIEVERTLMFSYTYTLVCVISERFVPVIVLPGKKTKLMTTMV